MEKNIDIERTKSEYRSQLDSFMNCFIMTCSPYNEGIEDLQREAEEREKDTSLSWLSQAAGFCSFHTIENVYHVNEPNFHPYLDIRLENISSLTSNYFIWNSCPCFEVPLNGVYNLLKEYGTPTSSMFLNISQAEAQIGYLKENVGRKILYCYGFQTENDFGKFRWCYRFTTEEYLREAILQTQAFVLDFLLNHPLDCFNGPFIQGEPDNIYSCAGKSKQEILLPILNEYYPAIMDRKDKIDGELKRRGLESESI